MADKEKETPRPFVPISEIPKNPNSLLNGLQDPQPELGDKGAGWRAWWSWIKGWRA